MREIHSFDDDDEDYAGGVNSKMKKGRGTPVGTTMLARVETSRTPNGTRAKRES